ncbi:MAG: TonB-dependent receptor, partial [Gammaproteobacteria bacterium]|nr:TonB-dependent receptor [Gammaproteobacteria bacterium]
MKKILAALLLWPAIAVPDSNFLDEVVVTATRSEKLRQVIPYTVDVVSQEDIKLSSQAQLADILGELPGVLVTDSGQAGQKRIRIRGEEARRVAFLIDNQEFVDHREVGVPLLVDLNRIQRIEVVRSPASVLYGPRAMGGVINVITKRESTRPLEFDLKSTYNGATDGYTVGIQLAGATSAGFNWEIGGSENRQDLRETPVGEIERTEYENSSFNTGLSYRYDDHEIALGFESFDSSSEVYVEPEVRFTPPFRDFIIDAPQRDREKLRFDYRYSPANDRFQSLSFDAYRQKSEREFNTFPFLTLFPGFNVDSRILTASELDSDGFNIQTDWLLGRNWALVTGLQWVEDSVSQTRLREVETNGFLTTSETQIDEATLSSLAWYAQLEIEVGDFTLLPGIRTYRVDGEMDVSNHFNALPEFDDTHTVSSFAVSYTPVESSTFRASYSEGYIYPSLFNLVMGAFAGSSFINPVTDLVPETSETWELGYRYAGDQWSLDAVLFQTHAEDYIDHVRCLPGDGCPGPRDEIYKNVGESSSHGVELTVDYSRGDYKLESSITWLQRHKDYDGVETWDSGVPLLSGRISASHNGSMLGK